MKTFSEVRSRAGSVARGTKIKTGKDHQVLNYTTRGGEKRSIKVHKDKAFSALSHYRSMGHTNVHLEKKEDKIDELSTALATRAAKKADAEYDHYKKKKDGAMAYHRGSQARSFKHYAKSGEYYGVDR